MNKLPLSLLVCTLPMFCNASDAMGVGYSVSSIYTGIIGKSNVTMNLVNSKGIISGSYIYDKYKKKILLNGVVDADSIELKENTNKSTATITLARTEKGYVGKWCDKKCVPVNIETTNSFRDGELKDIQIDESDVGSYNIKMEIGSKHENVVVSDAIDLPSLVFVDINGDGFYDLIAITDHRPNNGSQNVYLSSKNGFIKNEALSKENGTLVYDPYKKDIVFNSKDDCCDNYNKIVYSLDNGKVVRNGSASFDYTSNKGKNSKGDDISKEKFESY